MNSVTITASRDEVQQITIESITAGTQPAELPDWLGKRPPVEGEWVETFREEFDGSSVNLTKWNLYTANYWDQLSHFSKDNVLVKDGVARLRYEKKKRRHNDDPNGRETPFASGFLDNYSESLQRYGYLEAYLKLPYAPGLWPAFWLMPDHDRDGFITSGVLWLPGKVVLYSNGRVVARWESPRVCSVPCDLIFTHVMGGRDNNDLDDAMLPAHFVIAYVRCWRRKGLASKLDGVQSTQPTLAAPVKPD